MAVCFGEAAVDVAAIVETRGTSQGNLKWQFLPSAANPPEVRINRWGTMDFRRVRGPIRLTLTLNDPDPARSFYSGAGVNVFGYSADGSYDGIRPVGPDHPQVQIVSLSDDARTVTICYGNRSEWRQRSIASVQSNVRYTLYLGERGRSTYLPMWIDPIISNGGQPMRDL
jgi:hypothetical protein